ncbi:MAG: hypothetical protein MUC63_08595, partial [Planctomycetes bacterium]|nr:hypothetical protein [Planctomycetota bacterium]
MPFANDGSAGPGGPAPGRCPQCGTLLPPGESLCPRCAGSGKPDDVLKEVEDLLETLFEPGEVPAEQEGAGEASPAAGPPPDAPVDAGEMKTVDELLDRISDTDALFAEKKREKAPPGAPRPPVPAPKSPAAPSPKPGKPKPGRDRKSIDEALSKAEQVNKVRRITVVERRKKHSRIFRRSKVKCQNCNQVFEPAQLGTSVDKCLFCGSKMLKWVDETVVTPRTDLELGGETATEEPEAELVEAAGEEAAEPEEAPAAEPSAAEAGVPGQEGAPPPEEPPVDGDLVRKRTGQKDYFAAFREPENIYAEPSEKAPPACSPEGARKEGKAGGGWGEALLGELALKKRAQEEAALKDDFFIGKKIGGYKVQGLIGRGAMGTVFKAEAEDGKPVALKILPPVFACDSSKVE